MFMLACESGEDEVKLLMSSHALRWQRSHMALLLELTHQFSSGCEAKRAVPQSQFVIVSS